MGGLAHEPKAKTLPVLRKCESDDCVGKTRTTVEAEINPLEPLKAWFSYGGSMTSTYMDYDGLSTFIRDVCKNPQYIRRLEIRLELDKEGAKGDA